MAGAGPIAQFPTNTDDRLGNDRWSLGASAVALKMSKGSPWIYGALVNNVWSVGGSDSDPNYSNLLIQPFLNYNFTGGFYLSSAPIITAAWKADSGDRWTVPLGGGLGKIVQLGRLPLNLQLQAYYNKGKEGDLEKGTGLSLNAVRINKQEEKALVEPVWRRKCSFHAGK